MTDVEADPASSGPSGPVRHRGDRSTLAKGGALNLIGMGLYGALNFVLILVVTRRLGATGAGAFLVAIGVFNILTKTAIVGADAGLLRFVPKLRAIDRPDRVPDLFRVALWPVLVIGVVFAVACFALAGPLADLLATHGGEGDLETYLRVMAPFIPAGAAYIVLESGSRSLGTMVPSLAIERIARPFLQPAAFLLVTSAGLGAIAIGLSWAVPTGLAVVPMAIWVAALVRRAQHVHQAYADDDVALDAPIADPATMTRRFWRFSGPRALGGMFQVLVVWIDTLLVGALASTGDAGIYGAATRWLIVGSFAGLAIIQAISPQISLLLARREQARGKRLFEVATAWQMLVAIPAYLTVMIFAPTLLDAFGTGFSQGRDALVILGAANIFAAACGAVEVVLLMAGRSTLNLIDTAVALALNIVLNIILIPHLGITGSAIAWAASLFVTNAVPMVQVWKLTGMHPFGRCWAHAAAICGVLAVVQVATMLVLGQSIVSLLAGVALAGAALVALVARFRVPLDLDDLVAAFRARRGQGQTAVEIGR